MSMVINPDNGQLERWLKQAGIAYYICDQCHALHLNEIQLRDGVLDARLFVEDEGLLLTTELELRPSALFLVQADISRLNMLSAGLKVFIDLNDETLPRLLICDFLISAAGVSYEQLVTFVERTLSDTEMLHDECARLGYLYDAEAVGDMDAAGPAGALH